MPLVPVVSLALFACANNCTDDLLLNQGIDADSSATRGSRGGRSQAATQNREVELVPIGLIGPGLSGLDAFGTGCDQSEDSFDRCL